MVHSCADDPPLRRVFCWPGVMLESWRDSGGVKERDLRMSG